MKLGGAVVVGGTLLMAAMDGGLTACITGVVTGTCAYVSTRRALNLAPAKVLARQKAGIDHNIAVREQAKIPDAELKNYKSEAKAQYERMVETYELQRLGNRKMALLYGIAGFAVPLVGIVTTAVATENAWRPLVQPMLKKMADMVPAPAPAPVCRQPAMSLASFIEAERSKQAAA